MRRPRVLLIDMWNAGSWKVGKKDGSDQDDCNEKDYDLKEDVCLRTRRTPTIVCSLRSKMNDSSLAFERFSGTETPGVSDWPHLLVEINFFIVWQ